MKLLFIFWNRNSLCKSHQIREVNWVDRKVKIFSNIEYWILIAMRYFRTSDIRVQKGWEDRSGENRIDINLMKIWSPSSCSHSYVFFWLRSLEDLHIIQRCFPPNRINPSSSDCLCKLSDTVVQLFFISNSPTVKRTMELTKRSGGNSPPTTPKGAPYNVGKL